MCCSSCWSRRSRTEPPFCGRRDPGCILPCFSTPDRCRARSPAARPARPARNNGSMHMDKTYQPAELEQKWYRTWEQAGYFAPDGSGAPHCIAIPPPNVTGSLHMGHAFQHTLMDALIRYQRMRGRDALWQVGTDHAGIATQMVVERRLGQAGQSRHDLGREDRKSTRLNSSHVAISYAVFCLKKKIMQS